MSVSHHHSCTINLVAYFVVLYQYLGSISSSLYLYKGRQLMINFKIPSSICLQHTPTTCKQISQVLWPTIILGKDAIQESPCSDGAGTCTCSCNVGVTVSGRCPSSGADVKCCYPSKQTHLLRLSILCTNLANAGFKHKSQTLSFYFEEAQHFVFIKFISSRLGSIV